MITLDFLQNYWWLLISILGGLLVFLLFVQGGQTLLISAPNPKWQQQIVDAIGSKWELTYTTLVTFGGAAFASFPLFYSTSFGGAYWLWILILFTFVVQAVSYEYRRKPGNLLGEKTYNVFLFINGSIGCILLGEAVATFFFGADFTVTRTALLNSTAPVISTWDNPSHGFELIFNWRNCLLGFSVFLLARILGILYVINSVNTSARFRKWLIRRLWIATPLFLAFFLAFLAVLFTQTGLTVTSATPLGTTTVETPYKYFDNLISSLPTLILLLLGIVCVLVGIVQTLMLKKCNSGIWFTGFGTFAAVVALLWLAGYNDTPFLPSNTSPTSSLSIHNASSSKFTLECMAWGSLLIPFVIAYIAYVWRTINKSKIP